MEYKELERREETTVFTKVLFTFKDGSTKEVDIPHFKPENEKDIELGISNRFISESRDLGLLDNE